MPEPLIEVAEFTADVTVPVAADPRTAASVRTPLQALANRTKHINDKLDLLLPGYGADRELVIPLGAAVNSPDKWRFDAPPYIWTQISTSVPIIGVWNLRLPHRGLLTRLRVSLEGAGSHVGLPAVMPTVSLIQRGDTNSSGTLVATATDGSASTGAYQSGHIVELASLTENLGQGREYSLVITGESSTNALIGLVIKSVSALIAEAP